MNSKILVCGRSGRGKTTFAKKLIAELRHPLVIVYDHQSEFMEYSQARTFSELGNGIKAGASQFAFVEDVDPTQSSLAAAFDCWLSRVFSVCKQSAGNSESGRILIVADEINSLVPQYVPNPLVTRIMEVSRRAKIDYLFCCHRLSGVHPSMRAQFTTIYQFRENEPRTLKLLEDYVPAETVQNIPDFEPIKIDLD